MVAFIREHVYKPGYVNEEAGLTARAENVRRTCFVRRTMCSSQTIRADRSKRQINHRGVECLACAVDNVGSCFPWVSPFACSHSQFARRLRNRSRSLAPDSHETGQGPHAISSGLGGERTRLLERGVKFDFST